ncbi:MAG: exosome complex RNA-binding protein Csl4 [Candidatus Bathyarchaeia archaeon]
MQDRQKNEKWFVIPGDKLGVVEQFMPGKGTYEINGTIYAKTIGYVNVDVMNKNISVIPVIKKPIVPKEGDVIIGKVSSTQEKIAIIKILEINNYKLFTPFTGMLHISSASKKYEPNMDEVCKAGDIIRARIINTKNKFPQLTTDEKNLGVIKAFCSKCGNALYLLKDRNLRCLNCENIEKRKVANDYENSLEVEKNENKHIEENRK